MMRAMVALLTSAGLATAHAAEAGSVSDEIDIDGFALRPASSPGQLRWHPYLQASAGLDTNPTLSNDDDIEADVFYAGMAGVQLDWDSPTARFEAAAEGGYREYQDVDRRDQVPLRARGRWEAEEAFTGYAVDGEFEQEQRPDATNAFNDERREYELAGTWWREGRFRLLRLQLGGRLVDYTQSDDPRSDNQDVLQVRALADFLPSVGTDRRWGLLARSTVTRYTEDASLAQDGIAFELLGTWLRELDENSRLLLRLGVEVGFYQGHYAEDEDYGDQLVVWPAGEVEWRHLLGPKGSNLALAVTSGLIPGERSNARGFLAAAGEVELRPARRWGYDGRLALSHRRDSGADAGFDPVVQTTVELELGATYLFTPAAHVRATWRWRENRSDNDEFEYSQHILVLAAAAAF